MGLKIVRGGYCDTDVTFVRHIESSIKSEFVCGIENHLIGTDDLKFFLYKGLTKEQVIQ